MFYFADIFFRSDTLFYLTFYTYLHYLLVLICSIQQIFTSDTTLLFYILFKYIYRTYFRYYYYLCQFVCNFINTLYKNHIYCIFIAWSLFKILKHKIKRRFGSIFPINQIFFFGLLIGEFQPLRFYFQNRCIHLDNASFSWRHVRIHNTKLPLIIQNNTLFKTSKFILVISYLWDKPL